MSGHASQFTGSNDDDLADLPIQFKRDFQCKLRGFRDGLVGQYLNSLKPPDRRFFIALDQNQPCSREFFGKCAIKNSI
jgi:hypothetical protein